MQERDRIQKAREALLKIAQGINPMTGEKIGEESLLNDPRMIRCFYFVSGVLDNVTKGVYSKKSFSAFAITPEQKGRVVLPEGLIGVNEFSRCINEVLDLSSKKLTGVELNKRLKQMGILSELKNDVGKTTTTTNENSFRYGFELAHRSYNGREYDMVVINDTGKKYLLEHLESIMGLETSA